MQNSIEFDTYEITQKSIVRQLDRAAARAGSSATGKQVWYLASLMFQAGDDADQIGCGCLDTNARLTGREASEWIDFYKNGQKFNTAA